MRKHPAVTLSIVAVALVAIGGIFGYALGNYQAWINEEYIAPTILKFTLGLIAVIVAGFLIGTVFDGISGGVLDTLGKIGAVIAVGLIALNWSYIYDQMGIFAIIVAIGIGFTAATTAAIIRRRTS